MKVAMRPMIGAVEPAHPSAVAAVDELELLTRQVPSVSVVRDRHAPPAGQKGGWVDLILLLGSPSAAAGLLAAWRLWLRRDRARSLTVTVSHDDGRADTVIHIEGEAVSTANIEAALESAFQDDDRPLESP